ncbi:hypothetical protein HDU96_007997 [Phlyctochytrium bullatum]|nr:hypothetical protein HDU96_007997 [Phlyctochytrium bullatum]
MEDIVHLSNPVREDVDASSWEQKQRTTTPATALTPEERKRLYELRIQQALQASSSTLTRSPSTASNTGSIASAPGSTTSSSIHTAIYKRSEDIGVNPINLPKDDSRQERSRLFRDPSPVSYKRSDTAVTNSLRRALTTTTKVRDSLRNMTLAVGTPSALVSGARRNTVGISPLSDEDSPSLSSRYGDSVTTLSGSPETDSASSRHLFPNSSLRSSMSSLASLTSSAAPSPSCLPATPNPAPSTLAQTTSQPKKKRMGSAMAKAAAELFLATKPPASSTSAVQRDLLAPVKAFFRSDPAASDTSSVSSGSSGRPWRQHRRGTSIASASEVIGGEKSAEKRGHTHSRSYGGSPASKGVEDEAADARGSQVTLGRNSLGAEKDLSDTEVCEDVTVPVPIPKARIPAKLGKEEDLEGGRDSVVTVRNSMRESRRSADIQDLGRDPSEPIELAVPPAPSRPATGIRVDSLLDQFLSGRPRPPSPLDTRTSYHSAESEDEEDPLHESPAHPSELFEIDLSLRRLRDARRDRSRSRAGRLGVPHSLFTADPDADVIFPYGYLASWPTTRTPSTHSVAGSRSPSQCPPARRRRDSVSSDITSTFSSVSSMLAWAMGWSAGDPQTIPRMQSLPRGRTREYIPRRYTMSVDRRGRGGLQELAIPEEKALDSGAGRSRTDHRAQLVRMYLGAGADGLKLPKGSLRSHPGLPDIVQFIFGGQEGGQPPRSASQSSRASHRSGSVAPPRSSGPLSTSTSIVSNIASLYRYTDDAATRDESPNADPHAMELARLVNGVRIPLAPNEIEGLPSFASFVDATGLGDVFPFARAERPYWDDFDVVGEYARPGTEPGGPGRTTAVFTRTPIEDPGWKSSRNRIGELVRSQGRVRPGWMSPPTVSTVPARDGSASEDDEEANDADAAIASEPPTPTPKPRPVLVPPPTMPPLRLQSVRQLRHQPLEWYERDTAPFPLRRPLEELAAMEEEGAVAFVNGGKGIFDDLGVEGLRRIGVPKGTVKGRAKVERGKVVEWERGWW